MKTKIFISIVIGFLLGASTIWLSYKFHHSQSSEAHHRHMIKMFSSRLHLDKNQQEKVTAILENTWKKIDALRNETRPKFEEIRHQTREEIKVLLDPQQQKKYEKLEAEMDARWKKDKHP